MTTKARHSIMLMLLSKLYQDIKQEKIAGWSASVFHYIQKLHREETCFLCTVYLGSIYPKLDADQLIGLLPGSQWEEYSKSPFVFATVEKLYFLHPKFQGAAWFVRDLIGHYNYAS